MTPIHKLLSELSELEAKATSGPWHIGHVNERDESCEIDSTSEGCGICTTYFRNDQAFIATSRNALPKLIEAMRVLVETCEFYKSKKHIICAEDVNWSDPEGYNMYDVNYIEEGLRAKQAIERVEEILKN